MAENKNEKILDVKNLRISFKTNGGTVKAVRDISFSLYKGRVLAIVGESGSGKSVTSKAILGILANNKIIEDGQIIFEGKDLLKLNEEDFTKLRGVKISMIFQDPLSALNPIIRVGKQLTEAMKLKAKATRHYAKKRLKQFKKGFYTYLDKQNAKELMQADFFTEVDENNLKIAISKLQNNIAKIKEASDISKLSNLLSTNSKLLEAVSKVDKYHKEDGYKEINDKVLSLINQLKADANNPSYLVDAHNLMEEEEKLIANYSSVSLETKQEALKEKFYSDISKASLLAFNSQQEKLALALEAAKAYNEEYLKDLSAFNLMQAKKALRPLSKLVKASLYTFNYDTDNVLAVFPITMKDCFASFNNAKKLVRDSQKVLEKYQAKTIYDLPPQVRAKEREVIVQPEEYFKKMQDTLNELILHIEELLKRNETVVPYLAEGVYNAFVSDKGERRYTISNEEAKRRALSLMEEVGIPEPERRFYQYPFEFSGGMRQRMVIAIALSSNPEVLICDEPTTALDVTIQAQILELINQLKVERNLSIIFITHDLGVVANMADDIAVMYAGKIVEYGTVYDIFYDPRHPYTWALLGSMPDLKTKEKLNAIPGTPPNMLLPPKGDAFAVRNKYAIEMDYEEQPPYFAVSDTHFAATWLLHPLAPDVKVPSIVRRRIQESLEENPSNIPHPDSYKNSILKEIERR